MTEIIDVTDHAATGAVTDLGLRASIVIPVYNEADAIVPCLQRIVDIVSIPFEVLVVYDSPDDTTVPFVEDFHQRDPRVRGVCGFEALARGPSDSWLHAPQNLF